MAATNTGKVKWFSSTRGFGFITPDNGGPDLFAHYSAILTNGYKELTENQAVTFEVIQGTKGLQAGSIKPV